jgi:hypothetical protein
VNDTSPVSEVDLACWPVSTARRWLTWMRDRAVEARGRGERDPGQKPVEPALGRRLSTQRRLGRGQVLMLVIGEPIDLGVQTTVGRLCDGQVRGGERPLTAAARAGRRRHGPCGRARQMDRRAAPGHRHQH